MKLGHFSEGRAVGTEAVATVVECIGPAKQMKSDHFKSVPWKKQDSNHTVYH